MLEQGRPSKGSMLRKPLSFFIIVLAVLSLAACDLDMLQSQLETSPSVPNALTNPIGTDNTGWQQIDAAMELRTMRLEADTKAGNVTVVRFDPAAYDVNIMYDAANPGSVAEWFEAIDPILVMNGGYFDERQRATALVIIDGAIRGESYQGFGGMVVVNGAGQFELRSLRYQPYDPGEPLYQAMQSAPMLIQPGGVEVYAEPDQERSRRSVIARDTSGRILLIVSDLPEFTLAELAQGLHRSDLEIDAALNMDGGRSTGLYLQTDTTSLQLNSWERVPLVLAVKRL
jgi:uncharacterized protein YigE (DUF2233 family)